MCANAIKAELAVLVIDARLACKKLKLAPPEHCNTLRQTSTLHGGMTAGRALVPTNPYFLPLCARLLFFILLARQEVLSRAMG